MNNQNLLGRWQIVGAEKLTSKAGYLVRYNGKIHYQNYVKWYLYFRNLKRKRKRGKRGKKRFS